MNKQEKTIISYSPSNIILIKNPSINFINEYKGEIAVVGSSCWIWENQSYESGDNLLNVMKEIDINLYKNILQEPAIYMKKIPSQILDSYFTK